MVELYESVRIFSVYFYRNCDAVLYSFRKILTHLSSYNKVEYYKHSFAIFIFNAYSNDAEYFLRKKKMSQSIVNFLCYMIMYGDNEHMIYMS